MVRTNSWLTPMVAAGMLVAAAMAVWSLSPRSERSAPRLRMSALITSAGDNRGARFSPDGSTVSFLSDGEGSDRIGLIEADAEFFLQPLPGRVLSTAWSPDSATLAALVEEDGWPLLTFVELENARGLQPRVTRPASLAHRDVQQEARSIRLRFREPRLIRWIGENLYLEAEGNLWSYEPRRGFLRRIGEPDGIDAASDFDVRADEQAVAFVGRQQGQSDVWSSDLEFRAVRRLTDDDGIERRPRWAGPDSVILSLDRVGQPSLWRLGVESGERKQLTTGDDRETVEDVLADGRRILVQRSESAAHIYRIEPGSRRERQMTMDRAQDFWPSASRSGLVAYQRQTGSGPDEALDGQILFLADAFSTPVLPVAAVGEGYGARVSPDGHWVGFLRRAIGAGGSPMAGAAELRVEEVQTGRAVAIAPLFDRDQVEAYPFELERQRLVWSRDSDSVYFAGRNLSGAPEIGRILVPSGRSERLVIGHRDQTLGELTLSRDGTKLGYLARGRSVQVRELDLESGKDRTVFDDAAERGQTGNLARGWRRGNGDWLLIRAVPGGEAGAIDVVELGAGPVGGGPRLRRIAEATGAQIRTARFDPAADMLYITLSTEMGTQNLYSLSVASKGWTRLTENRFPGTTITGIDIVCPGALLYSRQREERTIWMLEASQSF